MVNKAVSAIQLFCSTCIHFTFQQVFLPEEKNCPLGFLHEILGGEKYVFWTFQVTTMHIPQWPEFSIKNMWD